MEEGTSFTSSGESQGAEENGAQPAEGGPSGQTKTRENHFMLGT